MDDTPEPTSGAVVPEGPVERTGGRLTDGPALAARRPQAPGERPAERLSSLWGRLLDWFDRRRLYGPVERAALAGLEDRTDREPLAAGGWIARVEFHAVRGDFERAARVLADVPESLRGLAEVAGAREKTLAAAMSALASQLGLIGERGRPLQSIARTATGGQLISVRDVLLEEVLEIREALLELRKTDGPPHLVLLQMRSSLPQWRLERLLERETARRRPDVKGFVARMEPGRLRIKCTIKGIPLTIDIVLELASDGTLRVRFDPGPKVFWVVPIPRSELDRALEALAAGGPEGFMTDVTGEGFVLDFARLLAPMTCELNLRHVDLMLGEVRTVAGRLEPMEPAAPPAPFAAEAEWEPPRALPVANAAAAILEAQAAAFWPVAFLASSSQDQLERRCRARPLDPAVYRELARKAHSTGRHAIARTAFSALALLDPEDREANEYLRAAAARPLPPPAGVSTADPGGWLRSPAEQREPASRVFRALAAKLGYSPGPPAPPNALPAGPERFPQHAAWLREAALALGCEPCRLLVSDELESGAVPGSDFILAAPVLASRLGRAESLFVLGRALGHRMLGHVGLTGLRPDRLAVLAGMVHQLGAGWYQGARRFRPIRTLDPWLDAATVSELTQPCLELAPKLAVELPLWQAGMRQSADRAGLAACGNLRAAATAILAAGGGPSTGLPLERLLSLCPDDTVPARFHALLPFAVFELYGSAD
ncbi:MAG: hypothetical protein HY816_22475 [Candidatus Wallbacteria bacterium]|nr:hypothetical protein [Candidatus Wallbacteria bacterium]